MIGRHLTPEQLVAYRDRELSDREALEHLSACRTCRDRLADTRLLTCFLQPGEKQQQSSHPGAEALIAYLDEALSPSDADAVERHTRSCESCAARLIQLRRSSRGRPEADASPQLLERARRQFRTPHPRRSLGRALVEAAGKAWLRFNYQPDFGALPFSATLTAARPEPSLPLRSPSAASARRARLLHRLIQGGRVIAEAPMRAMREAVLERGSGRTLEIDAGPVHMELVGRPVPDGAELVISVRNAATKEPAGALELALIPERGAPFTTATDSRGRAAFSLPRGESRLRIYTEPVFELVLRY